MVQWASRARPALGNQHRAFSDMPELDPLSTQLPAMFHQVALLEVHNSRMLRQEHTLLEAYPSLRDDLIAAAKTVAPDAEEVLKKLSSAFFSRPLPGMNSPHLNFLRTTDQVGAKSWQIVTDVEQLYPSIRGTPLAEECKEILQRAIAKAEAHLLNMRATLYIGITTRCRRRRRRGSRNEHVWRA